jgi:hypothetical protein
MKSSAETEELSPADPVDDLMPRHHRDEKNLPSISSVPRERGRLE